MAYREIPVPPRLRGAVECGWAAGAAVDQPRQVHDVLPDGCMDLVWTGTELLVAGPDTTPHRSVREPGVTAVGLRFRPGALPALLGVPAAEVRDQRVPLAAVRPGPVGAATARIEHGAEPGAVLVELVLGLDGPPPDPAVRAVAGRLATGASAAATADALGWTTRSLHRRCIAAFGYGPVVLRRVLRFRRAVALLHAGVPITDAAAAAGYADQPHLSREVRALAGVSPAQLASGANRSTPLPSGSWRLA